MKWVIMWGVVVFILVCVQELCEAFRNAGRCCGDCKHMERCKAGDEYPACTGFEEVHRE